MVGVARRQWDRFSASTLNDAATDLGGVLLKAGQFLATRADLIGPKLAGDLRSLQDRLPPFSMAEARHTVEAELGGRLEDHFAEFGPPVAAASIAQLSRITPVHCPAQEFDDWFCPVCASSSPALPQ